MKQQNISANTKRVYLSRIKHFLLFLDYANLIDERFIEPDYLSDAISVYFDFLKNSQRENGTINANINALKNFLLFLGISGVDLKRKTCYSSPAKILHVGEQARLLKAIDEQKLVRDKAIALILLDTGMRLGHCAALTLDSIGPSARSVCIAKGKRMFLHEDTQLALRQWLEERKKVAGLSSNAALWLTNNGETLSIPGINFVLIRIGSQANLAVSAEMLRRISFLRSSTIKTIDTAGN